MRIVDSESTFQYESKHNSLIISVSPTGLQCGFKSTRVRTDGIDFFSSSEWPGNSPDFNATENLGAILKERVETKLIQERIHSKQVLLEIFAREIGKLRQDKSLLQRLLRSYPGRLEEALQAGGGHTDY